MIGPLKVKVSEIHIPNLSDVNTLYWKYSIEEHTLEGLGFVCPQAIVPFKLIRVIANLLNEKQFSEIKGHSYLFQSLSDFRH
jgi:hypothetical protein